MTSEQAAEQAVADFHKKYNAGQLAEIYSAPHSKLKGVTKEQEFLDYLNAPHQKLGKTTKTSNVGYNVETSDSTTTVVLMQTTTFERGIGIETFTFGMDGSKPMLLDYHIRSKELTSK